MNEHIGSKEAAREFKQKLDIERGVHSNFIILPHYILTPETYLDAQDGD
jgi:hypothetical protein